MFLRGVFRLVGGKHHQFQMHLQGGIAQNPAQLGLRYDFGGHQIQQNDFQGADLLTQGSVLRHHEDVFILQDLGSRQIVWNLNWHSIDLLKDELRIL